MNEETNTDSAVLQATDDTFEQDVMAFEGLALVDFWAPWCGPCKAIAPVLEEIATERTDIRVVKVNVDDSPETAKQFNVRAIPTLLLFKSGEVRSTKIGAAGKADIETMLEG